MPSFARELEQTLHNALAEASGRRHEYATLEHLLLALIEDVHAGRVMEACGVQTGELRDAVRHYLDTELESLKVSAETEPSPTSGFQRVVQRAIEQVSSRAAELLGGMAFINSPDVSYLLAASRALAFHPPSRLSIAPAIDSYMMGNPMSVS